MSRSNFKCPHCGQRDAKLIRLRDMKLKMTREWNVEKQKLDDPEFGPLYLNAECTACGERWQSVNPELFQRARTERIFV